MASVEADPTYLSEAQERRVLDARIAATEVKGAARSAFLLVPATLVQAILAWTAGAHVVALVVAALGLASSAWRASLTRRYNPRNLRQSDVRRRASLEVGGALLISGVAWALTIALALHRLPRPWDFVLTLMALGATASAAAFALYSSRAFLLYLLLLGAAFMIYLAQHWDDALSVAVAATVWALFTVTQYRATRSTGQTAFNLARRLARAALASRQRAQRAEQERLRAEADAASARQSEAESQLMAIAQVAHELRTPLQIILGGVERLEVRLARAADPAAREALSTIERSAEQLATVAREIGAYTRNNSAILRDAPVEHALLAETLQQAVQDLAPMAATRGLYLTLKVDEGSEAAVVDKLRTRTIVTNLITNGLKFCDAGGVSVRVWVSGAPARVFIQVRDTGTGIAADQLREIWRPWVRLDESRSGLGLGLAIVAQVAQQIGATVSATSVVGQGSTFEVSMPATPAAGPSRTA